MALLTHDQQGLERPSAVRVAIEASVAPATRKAYRSDWRDFTAWCDEKGCEALPASPETIALYIVQRATTLKASTLRRRLSSISVAHKTMGLSSPTTDELVRRVLRGTTNRRGSEFTAERRKRPLMTGDLRRIVHALGARVIDDRDRALLTIGFAGGMRRSELVGLNVEDFHQTADGLVVTIRRSKTDQTGAGREIGLPYASDLLLCPVRSFGSWVARGGIENGPVFRPVDRHGQVAATDCVRRPCGEP